MKIKFVWTITFKKINIFTNHNTSLIVRDYYTLFVCYGGTESGNSDKTSIVHFDSFLTIKSLLKLSLNSFIAIALVII